jgi:hypothetical protein
MDSGYAAALSGLIGAFIGSASSIATMMIQARSKDRRDRSRQVTDLSLAEFKMHVDLAASGKGPSTIPPLSTFAYNNNNLMLEALESGTLTPERMKEISKLNDAVYDTAFEIDRDRRKRN